MYPFPPALAAVRETVLICSPCSGTRFRSLVRGSITCGITTVRRGEELIVAYPVTCTLESGDSSIREIALSFNFHSLYLHPTMSAIEIL